jgi:hypothetical protein
MRSFRSDPVKTLERFAELDDYMTRQAYGRCGFVCESGTQLRKGSS